MLRTFAGLGMGLMLLAASTLVAEDSKAGQANASKERQGKLVRVDPHKGLVVIRNAAGKEQEFTMGPNAAYFGTDNKTLNEGLRSNLFRQGADVRYRVGQGNTLNELRLAPAAGAGGTGAHKNGR